MTATVYMGKDYALRMATSEADLAAATAIAHFRRCRLNVDQGISLVSDGNGARTTTPHSGLLKITGSIEFYDDEADVIGTEALVQSLEADVTGAMTPLYAKLTNIITGRYDIIRYMLGSLDMDVPSDEGIRSGTYTFSAAEVAFNIP